MNPLHSANGQYRVDNPAHDESDDTSQEVRDAASGDYASSLDAVQRPGLDEYGNLNATYAHQLSASSTDGHIYSHTHSHHREIE